MIDNIPPLRADAWLAAIVQSSSDAIISKTLDGIVTSWNVSAERIFGYSAKEMIGQSILKLIPEDRHKEEALILGKIRQGERLEHFETRRRRKDGAFIDISLTVSPIREEAGNIVGVSKIARDITEERRSRDTQRLLMREVNHRSRNLLAVVEAMIRQTVPNAAPAEFARSISGRIAGLSRTQDLIVRTDWQGVDLMELVRAHATSVASQMSDRLVILGPEIRVSPNAAQAIGLALHELFLGAAVRFNSSHSETIKVSWQGDQAERWLRFHWSEPQAGASGNDDDFFRSILEKVTPLSLNGTATLTDLNGRRQWTLQTRSDVAFGPQIVDPLGE